MTLYLSAGHPALVNMVCAVDTAAFSFESVRLWLIHWPPAIPLTIALMLAASAAMYAALVHRWTVWPRREDLRQWAWRNGMHMRLGRRARQPRALDVLGEYRAVVSLHDRHITMVRIECPPAGEDGTRPRMWNLVIRRVGGDWPVTCARPAAGQESVFDRLLGGEMYTTWSLDGRPLYGAQCLPTRALKQSGACEVLPGDVAMLLCGAYLLLDFSSRPFDEVEAARMRLIAAQAAARLPAEAQGQ